MTLVSLSEKSWELVSATARGFGLGSAWLATGHGFLTV